MTNVLRYGLIGAGMMGREHLRNIALVDEVEVVALADDFPESLERAAKYAPGAATHDSAEALLARDDLDAVVIATPNHTHVNVVPPAVEAGLHILCEKPLATTLDDARTLRDLGNASEKVFWVGMEYRYIPAVARLIAEVDAGTPGPLRMLSIREHRRSFLPKVRDWNRFNRNSGGTLVEKCCHHFDLMRRIVGREPVRIYASGAQDVNHLDERYHGETPDILDNAYVIVDFEGGVRAMLDLCMFAEGTADSDQISATGDTGKVECLLPGGAVRIGHREDRRVEESIALAEPTAAAVGSHHGSTLEEHRRFAAAIRTGAAPDVSADDGYLAVAMGLAAQQSIAEGRPVWMAELLG